MSEQSDIIVCENLVKIYKTQDLEVMALQGLDLTVGKGEMMAIIGNSGSGKSTLLNMLGGLDKPTAGVLTVDGKDLLKMNDRQMIQYKRETVGFVWQNNARNLIPYLTASENVEMPMIINSAKGRRERALELLDKVGLYDRRDSKLFQLSGGEQQRVAIAIALANSPKILLADEPTGAVDTKTAAKMLDLMRTLNRETGVTVVIVTHDRLVSKHVDRVISIMDGRTGSEMLIKKDYKEALDKLDALSITREDEDDTHDEFAVSDKIGRISIPKEYLEALGVDAKKRGRIKVELENGKVVLSKYEED